MYVYNTYGRRIINGYTDARSAGNLNVVDKEAILNCLIECRTLSRIAEKERIEKAGQKAEPNKDVMRKALARYTREFAA